MIQVLSIGNSFSEDAQRYLHQIAAQEGIALRCVNLFVPGCSLETHFNNLRADAPLYMWQENGEPSDTNISISQALTAADWDYVTLQQVSHLSPFFESYTPYIEELAKVIRTQAPQARLLIHQTWAYEQGSYRLTQELHYADQRDMLRDIRLAYEQAACRIEADGIIPCGAAMMNALDAGIPTVHRDGFHADLGIGRYLLGLTWFMQLTGLREMHPSIKLDIPVQKDMLLLAQQAVLKALAQ